MGSPADTGDVEAVKAQKEMMARRMGHKGMRTERKRDAREREEE
jgi:hypothetical protein